MQIMPSTVSSRTIQRQYRRVFDEVRTKKKPLIITTNAKPDVAIISMDLLEKLMNLEENGNIPASEDLKLTPQISNTAELDDNLDELAVDFKGKSFDTDEIDRIYYKRILKKHGPYLP